MTPSRWARYSGLVLALIVVALAGYSILSWDGSKGRVSAKYRSVASGMTPIEIRRILHDGGDVAWSQIGTADVYHLDGRYMIAVEYEPNPNLPAVAPDWVRPVKDDWVVKRKVLVELGRGGVIDPLLVGLRLRPPRIVENDSLRR